MTAVIANETFSAPSAESIAELQELIDPQPQGEGIGIAPVEHVVNAIAVDELDVNVATHVTLEDDGMVAADIQGQVDTIVARYLQETAETWADVNRLTIVRSQIEARVLDIEGVLDCYDTTLNGLAQNLILGEFEVPKKGVVTVV